MQSAGAIAQQSGAFFAGAMLRCRIFVRVQQNRRTIGRMAKPPARRRSGVQVKRSGAERYALSVSVEEKNIAWLTADFTCSSV